VTIVLFPVSKDIVNCRFGQAAIDVDLCALDILCSLQGVILRLVLYSDHKRLTDIQLSLYPSIDVPIT